MTRYRVHRIKETQKETFRWSAHMGGTAVVKPKDYELGEEIEANTPYAAWQDLQMEGTPLSPGDMLETLREDGVPGELQIAKYIGFEAAKWLVPEPKTEATALDTTSTLPVNADSQSA